MREDLICKECVESKCWQTDDDSGDWDWDADQNWVAYIWLGRVLNGEFQCWPEVGYDGENALSSKAEDGAITKISIGTNLEGSVGETFNGSDNDPRDGDVTHIGTLRKIRHNCQCGCDGDLDADVFSDSELKIINDAIKRDVDPSHYFTLEAELDYCQIEVEEESK